MYVPSPVAGLIAALGSADWQGKAKAESVESLLLDICDRLRCSVVWSSPILNMLGPSYVARIQILHCVPAEVFLKFCPPPNDVRFSSKYKAIREPLWQYGLFHIYGVTQNWVVMEDVPQLLQEDLDLIPTNELIADLWLRIHNVDTHYFDDVPYIDRPNVADTLLRFFSFGHDQSRNSLDHVRILFDDLKSNFDLVFSAVLFPDPRDIVFGQGELYPRHTSFVRRGANWECRVIDWDSPMIVPRWHDLTFYLRVSSQLEDETLLPLYIRRLSTQIPRDFDEVMGIYFQYSLLRTLIHMPAGQIDRYFREDIAERYRKWLLR